MEEKGLELSWNDCPKDESCYLYVGDHCVGEIQNEIEFMWIRIQIAEQKFSGCYIMFQGKKYEIDENGNMENRPNNLFTTYTQLLAKYIVTTQISRDKKTKIHIPTSKITNYQSPITNYQSPITNYQSPILLSGDTLFKMGYGRTDLPGGNYSQLIDSLDLLFALPSDVLVYPGHGEPTTIGAETGYYQSPITNYQ